VVARRWRREGGVEDRIEDLRDVSKQTLVN